MLLSTCMGNVPARLRRVAGCEGSLLFSLRKSLKVLLFFFPSTVTSDLNFSVNLKNKMNKGDEIPYYTLLQN